MVKSLFDKPQIIAAIGAGCLAVVAALLVVALPTPAWAGEMATMAARWPLVLTSGAVAVAGLLILGWKKSWDEMGATARARRILAVAMVAGGFFGGLYGLTEVPPGGEEVQWLQSYQQGQQVAQATGRPLMVDFTADWCAACQELDAEVFREPTVRKRLETEFVAVKLDYDHQTEDTIAAIDRFEVGGLPRVAFETARGEFLRGPSFEGKVDVEDFHRRLDQVLAGDDAEPGGWLETTLSERGLLAIFLLVFGAGILASLSPCVYPLIPITIGILGAQDVKTRRRGFILSLSYVGGIVVTYSLLGVVAAILGTVFGGFFQHIWFQGALAVIFALLALGCLGGYDIRLPGPLQTRLGQMGGAGLAGAFLMGLAAGVLAVPCIGPVVAGILIYVAEQQDVLFGGALLTVFAVGMGLLFVVLGTFSTLLQRLPRAGGWMEGVKALFGGIFLGLALYYLRLVVPWIGRWTDEIWLLLHVG